MKQIRQLIKEDRYILKMKPTVNFREPKEFLKIVIDMANGEEIGYLVFGINKKNEIIGIKKIKQSYQEINKCIKRHIEPDIENVIIIANIEGKNIILLKIIPQKGKVHYYRE